MLEDYKQLPVWFRNRLKKVMEHNNYHDDWLTVDICKAADVWTPVDLIVRERLNNYCTNAEGFLNLSFKEAHHCYEYIYEHKELFKELNLLSEEGINNHGYTLWKEWLNVIETKNK